tara:strand:- start:1515 stop:1757 length:243 start_codon:yes stop_codon:yes gene_type:complete
LFAFFAEHVPPPPPLWCNSLDSFGFPATFFTRVSLDANGDAEEPIVIVSSFDSYSLSLKETPLGTPFIIVIIEDEDVKIG